MHRRRLAFALCSHSYCKMSLDGRTFGLDKCAVIDAGDVGAVSSRERLVTGLGQLPTFGTSIILKLTPLQLSIAH